MSIRKKILALSATLVLLFLALNLLYWTPEAERRLIANIEANAHDKLNITSEVLVPLLIKQQYAAIHENMDAILKINDDWVSLELYDDTERRIYPLETLTVADNADFRFWERDIIFHDNRLGKLRLTIDPTPVLHEFRSWEIKNTAIRFALFLGFLAAANYFIHVFVSMPAMKLVEAANSLANGDYNSPLPKTGDDELGKLTRAFDEMRQAVLQKTGTIQQFGQIMDDSINEIYLFDPETLLFRLVNGGARKNLQYSLEELREMTFVDINPEMTEAEFRGLVAPLLAGKAGNISFTTRHRRKDGSEYSAELNLQLSKVTDPPVFIAVAQDITERLEAERKMRESNENLEAQIYERTHQLRQEIEERKRAFESLNQAREEAFAANHTKSEFLAHMSHELRSPLNAIIGFSEAIKFEVFGKIQPPQYEEYMYNILASGQHLLELINDILDLSAVESGNLELTETEVDIGRAFDMVLTMLRPRAENKRLRIINAAPCPFPALRADERRIKQILINLITNAIKFTERNGKIELIASIRDDGSMALSVADTGIGMSKEQQATAMTEFGQVRNTSFQAHEGTGLGLPLCAALAEKHGGGLEIESVPGKGTTMTARFPADRVVLL